MGWWPQSVTWARFDGVERVRELTPPVTSDARQLDTRVGDCGVSSALFVPTLTRWFGLCDGIVLPARYGGVPTRFTCPLDLEVPVQWNDWDRSAVAKNQQWTQPPFWAWVHRNQFNAKSRRIDSLNDVNSISEDW